VILKKKSRKNKHGFIAERCWQFCYTAYYQSPENIFFAEKLNCVDLLKAFKTLAILHLFFCCLCHGEANMLETIAIILVILWLLGLVSSYTLGGFIHLLLILAIVVILLRVIQGRRAL